MAARNRWLLNGAMCLALACAIGSAAESKIEGLTLEPTIVERVRHASGDFTERVVLVGKFQRTGWSLSHGERAIPVDENGNFKLRVELTDGSVSTDLVAKGPKGATESEHVELLVADLGKEEVEDDTPTEPERKPANQIEASGIKRDTAERRWTLHPELSYQYLRSSEGGTLNGAGLGLRSTFGLSDKIGLVAGAVMARDLLSPTTGLFTRFDLGFAWAFSGKFRCRKETVAIAGQTVLRSDVKNACGGLRTGAHFSQYYFNGSSSTIPMSGFGLSVAQEGLTLESTTYSVGFRFDNVFRTGVSVMSFQLFGGLRYLF